MFIHLWYMNSVLPHISLYWDTDLQISDYPLGLGIHGPLDSGT